MPREEREPGPYDQFPDDDPELDRFKGLNEFEANCLMVAIIQRNQQHDLRTEATISSQLGIFDAGWAVDYSGRCIQLLSLFDS